MKVAHELDHITHAVIGGGTAMNFGISDDPAFFQILSSALYKNPTYSMCQETICNAWDAHIASGITDKALKITLDDEYLIIQDFGKGIPHDLIQPIYGIYGASTKKNDGNQTGGFGLGCKSPFSYNDHFEVTSCHEGVKTIYNMSRSSAQVGGRPSIVPIASFPTTETGITVKIPLNPEKSNHQIEYYILQVIFNGDIRADYNGKRQQILGLDQSQHGLLVISHEIGGLHLISQKGPREDGSIFIRYGNVVYPVESAPEYLEMFSRATTNLRSKYKSKLVIQAPPNSISVTPSRESLTLSDTTIQTVKMLLAKFLGLIAANRNAVGEFKVKIESYVDAAVVAEVENPQLNKLPLESWAIPGVPTTISTKVLNTDNDFLEMDIVLSYSSRHRLPAKTWLKHIQPYMYKINASNFYDRGLMQSWLRDMQRHIKKLSAPGTHSSYRLNTEEVLRATLWWQKNVLAPLYEKLTKAIPNFDRNQLHYRGFNCPDASYHGPALVRARRVSILTHTGNAIHLLKPTIILTHNADKVRDRIAKIRLHATSKGTLAKQTFFVYEVSRKKAIAEPVKEAFSQLVGVEFIDLTGRLPYEELEHQERQLLIDKERADRLAGLPTKTRLIKKAKKGMFRLDGLIDDVHRRVDTRKFISELTPTCIQNPTVVAQITTKADHIHSIEGMSTELSFIVSKLYGSSVGISNKTAPVTKAIKEASAVSLSDFVLASIMQDMENIPELLAYNKTSPEKIQNYIDENLNWSSRDDVSSICQLILNNREFSKLVPNVPTLSIEHEYRWTLWENLRSIAYSERAVFEPLKAKLDAEPLDPTLVLLIQTLAANPLLSALNIDSIRRVIRNTSSTKAEKDKLVAIVESVIS